MGKHAFEVFEREQVPWFRFVLDDGTKMEIPVGDLMVAQHKAVHLVMRQWIDEHIDFQNGLLGS